MGKLDNRVAIVTGASSGMGKEIARLFAEEGASVVAVARHREKLQDAIDGITAKGGKAIAVSGRCLEGGGYPLRGAGGHGRRTAGSIS